MTVAFFCWKDLEMNASRTASLAVAVLWLSVNQVLAQNPKLPTPLPAHIQGVDQLPKDAVVLWIEGNDLTVYIDSTSNPDDQNKITVLEIKWEGPDPGPGFVVENCYDCGFGGCIDFFPVCTIKKIAIVNVNGIGPVDDCHFWGSASQTVTSKPGVPKRRGLWLVHT